MHLKLSARADKKIREDALSSLRTFLKAKRDFTETDLLKLWKGLFYCGEYPSLGPMPNVGAEKLTLSSC